ncbi:alpha/beta hydrolase-fold protein [Rhodococcus sp. YH1]|uniref:alpha/beta hydrolase-fold protein n=1 Tax=Rhodococcus sp. YH1 TaxID=89066 RepID=UPI001386F7CA|nr:Diacylglycerol acyltransferase/mycolyltransferase Ag85A [Rhodococcus sp. YH1]
MLDLPAIRRRGATVAVALLAATSLLTAPALAQPAADADPAGAYVDHVEERTARDWVLHVYSPSMDRVIPVEVIRPADISAARPTFYLLNGAGGGEDAANWRDQTDVREFFDGKNVNVVTPVGGAFAYYTDWIRDDPKLGRHRWATFLTSELPPVVDAVLGADGRNAVAGMSMSGSSVLALAQQSPGLYEAVASYSGCAQTSSDPGRSYVEAVVTLGGGDVENMWGPIGGPGWIANDAALNAEKLRGTTLYISSGGGLPGPHEAALGGQVDPVDLVVLGSIEAATAQCTERLRRTFDELGIEATFSTGAQGTHSWGYWQDALHESWPILAEAIGA